MQVKGTVSTIRFRSEENGWTVFVLSSSDGEITCTGTFLLIQEGEMWELEGDLIYHPKYGEQIQVRRGEKIRPKSEEQIERYLSSGLIPNIGPKTAKKLVESFGTEVIDRVIEDPSILESVPGIGEKKAQAIYQALVDQQSTRETAIFLQSLELGPKTSAQIIKTYGDQTQQVIEGNPYQLIEDIDGIGFRTADRLAIKNGMDQDSPFRIKAAVLYVLQKESQDRGASFLTQDQLQARIRSLLGKVPEAMDEVLFDLEIEGKIAHDHDQGRWYNKKIYDIENEIAAKLVHMTHLAEEVEDLYLDEKAIEAYMGIELSNQQNKAIRTACQHQVLVITGGPGTGKTTILRAILQVFDQNHVSTQLAAPTGRAAKRMEESTGREALTLHRLLGYRGGKDSPDLEPEKNEDDPLEMDAIVIDEASMIDIYLMGSLMRAVQMESRLIFVGDVDQLPSVGPGNVLQDLILSGTIATVKLNEIYRQSSQSMIVENAHRINRGQAPILNEADKDFFFLGAENPNNALEIVEDLVSRRLPQHYKLDPKLDIQVLSAMKKGPCGVENLNQVLQRSLNPKKEDQPEIEVGEQIFRVGDQVMQVRNNYQLAWKEAALESESIFGEKKMEFIEGEGVYNGDFGIIVQISPDLDWLMVDFDGRLVQYQAEDFRELNHSYAITIHKSQGSEFPCVVLPIVPGPPMLLSRNILYTGITRAKKLVVLVGDQNTFEHMIKNNRTQERNSSLDERLIHFQKLGDFMKLGPANE